MPARDRLLPLVAALLGGSWVGSATAAWPPPADVTATDLRSPTNWPGDPDYGFIASTDPGIRRDGQWQLYSFIPEQSVHTRLIRSGETASGSSVDRAWRLTVGDPQVRIAVVDSGIRWDAPDLVEKVWLNLGELASRPPLMQDGSPCAPLDPERPTEARFDCNADGVLTATDYATDPRLLPAATEEPCGEELCSFPAGDANANGVFDAGDLLAQSFIADGVDNDGNGFVDDIAGWDFVDHDPEPADAYDPEGNAHGTRRALEAAAETDNGVGGAGVCPRCRVLPLRVSDRHVAGPEAFAQAIIYAVDAGAAVVLATPSSLGLSSFARAAIDYAWDNGALVVTALGDVGSRLHDVPATSRHVLPVHAVTMAGANPESTTTTSFLAASPCGNFGAHNLLSAPSAGSSRAAAAHVAGVAGLVHSMVRPLGYGETQPRLEASELLGLLLTTADDVNLSESREAGSSLSWSQPGFEQHFGYGRINANRAVEWASAGRIPPAIDLVSPEWFEPLYADRVTAPVRIRGTISARRAQSYDYWVEWAPGVQPLEGAFTTIAQGRNVSGTEVTGGEAEALAELEIRSLSVSHEQDTDSPLGQNEPTLTLRVRAVAHYGGEQGDVGSEVRRAVTLHEDPDLLAGFPLWLGATGEASPKLADIDGDGVRDIVVATADGAVHVLRAVGDRPAPVVGFPFHVRHTDGLDSPAEQELRCAAGPEPDPDCFDYHGAPAYERTEGVDADLAREAILAAPAIADLTRDGVAEIVVCTYAGTLYAVRSDGTVLDGWPRRLPDVPPCSPQRETSAEPCRGAGSRVQRGALASPVLVDLDGDGRLDVVQAALDGRVHAYTADATVLPSWPVLVRHPDHTEVEPARIVSTPAAADFDGDGVLDLLVGSNQKLGTGGYWGAFYLLDGRGERPETDPHLPRWPITVSSFGLIPIVAEGTPGSAVAADFDLDGLADGALHGNASEPLIVPADPGFQNPPGAIPARALPEREDAETGQISRGLEPTRRFGADSAAPRIETMVPLFAQPSAGDLDQDGVPDLVTAGTYLDVAQNLAACAPATEPHAHLLGMWSGRAGAMLPGSPVPIEDIPLRSSQAIADVSGDGYPEVIASSAGYRVHAVDACGREPAGWPKHTGQSVWATPAVGDIDGDGNLEVVVLTRAGWLFAWRTEGSSSGVVAWESVHHDNRNTGHLGVPLQQGRLLGDSGPLQLDEQGRCLVAELPEPEPDAERRLSPSGGCGCRAAGRRSLTGWSLMLGLVLLAARRPRLRHGGGRASARSTM